MMTASTHVLQLVDLSYQFSNGQTIFEGLNVTFPTGKTALIGRNGLGKSTLLKLISGELIATSGQILKHDLTLITCPQDQSTYLSMTVAELLGFKEKIQALKNIEAGSTKILDFDTLGEDWDCFDQLNKQLELFNLKKSVAHPTPLISTHNLMEPLL